MKGTRALPILAWGHLSVKRWLEIVNLSPWIETQLDIAFMARRVMISSPSVPWNRSSFPIACG